MDCARILIRSRRGNLEEVRSPSIGGVRFTSEHYKSGGGHKAAYCDDLLSVSLLQARLNELGTGMAVEVG